jgi:hypothetical protein
MQKKITKPTSTKDITTIVGTKYVILPDNTVAKRLKSRIVHGTTRFNLWINNKFTTIAADELREWNNARIKSQSSDSDTGDTSDQS